MKNEKIIYFLLPLFALSLCLSIAGSSILLGVLGALWVKEVVWDKHRLPLIGKMEVAFLGYWLSGWVTACISGAFPTTFQALQKDLYFFLVLWGSVHFNSMNRPRFIQWLLIGVAISSTLGLMQAILVLTQVKLSSTYLHQILESIQSVLKSGTILFMESGVVGTRDHHLTYAEGLVIVFAVFLIWSGRSKTIRQMMGQLATAGLILGGIFFAKARGVWVSVVGLFMFMGLVQGVFFLKREENKNTVLSLPQWGGLLSAIGIVLLSVLSIQSVRENFVTRLSTISVHQTQDRYFIWDAAIKLFQTKPFFGIGTGIFEEASVPYRSPEVSRSTIEWSHTHSIYLESLVTRGIIGSIFFFWMWFLIFRELWQGLFTTDGDDWRVVLGSLCACVTFFIFGITESAYNDTEVRLLLYAILGLGLSVTRSQTKPSRASHE